MSEMMHHDINANLYPIYGYGDSHHSYYRLLHTYRSSTKLFGYVRAGFKMVWILPVRPLPVCLFKWGIILVNASKIWHSARICLRPYAVFNIHASWYLILHGVMKYSIVIGQ